MQYNTIRQRSQAAANALNAVFAAIVRPDPLTWHARPLKLQPDTLMLAEPRTGRTEAGRLREPALLCQDDAASLSQVFKQSGFCILETAFYDAMETHCLPTSFMGRARVFNLRITNPMLRTYNVHIKGLDAEIITQNKIAERLHSAFGYNPTRSVA